MNAITRSAISGSAVLWVAALVFAALPAGAGITWTGAVDGNWDTTTTNWTGDAATFTDDGTVDVTFDSSAGGSIAISSNMSPASTTVSASSGTYTFTGGPIDSGSLTKSGGGTLVVNYDHTFTGKTVVSGGTFTVNNLANVGVASPLGAPTGASATIDMYPGTLLKFAPPDIRSVYFSTDRTIDLAGAGPGTVELQCRWNDKWASFGAITGTGSGPRTLRLLPSGDRARIRITGPIADTSDDAVSLAVHFTSQASAGGRVYLQGTNTFSGPITITTSRTSKPENVHISGSGTLGGGSYSNTISIQTSITLNYESSATQELSGVISGAGSLKLSGAGTLTLSGTNTYSGGTTVSAGTLVAGATNALGAGNVSVSGGALVIDGESALGSGTVTVSGGMLVLDVANGMPGATLTLPSETGTNLTVNADNTVAALYINGSRKPNGLYTATGTGGGWMTGSGTLIVGSASAWWDINGATAGAGGATPAGTWDAALSNWSTDSDGTGTPTTWGAGLTAAFAAGSDATGIYTVNVGGTNDIRGINVEEGSVTVTNGALRLVDDGNIYVETASQTATVATVISEDGGSRDLYKSGDGTLVLSASNTYSGGTLVVAGTLGATADGAIGAGQVSIAGGATLHLTHSNAAASSAGIKLEASDSSLLCDTDITISNLTFDFGADYSFTGAQGLNFLPGGAIENKDNRYWITITNPITGSPAVNIKDYRPDGGNNTYKGIVFAPSSGTQTLGAILNPDNTGTKDKSGVTLGGSTAGNSVTSIGYAGGDRYGDVNKSGTGTWTVAGDINTGTYRHHEGTLVCNGRIKGDYQGFAFTAGTLSGNCTLTRNDRRGNIAFPSAFVVAPGTNSVGTMTIDWGTSGNPTAAQQWLKFQDGSIFEWDVGVSTNDVIHIVDGKVDLDNFVIRIVDAGGTPDVNDQLPVFTYEAGVTIDLTGFSNTIANFDTTDAPGWTGAALSLTDDGVNTIYLTGLSASAKGMVLIVQ